MLVTDIMVVLIWLILGESDCLPYMKNYIRCDFIISFLSLANLKLEEYQSKWKEELIGRYVLNKQHSMQKKRYDKVYNHFHGLEKP